PTELLIEAIWKEDLEAIQELIAAGADINGYVGHDCETPLSAAAGSRNPELLDYLLTSGAELECRDRDGNTALIEAASADDRAAAIRLLEAGGLRIGMPWDLEDPAPSREILGDLS
ncbi:MAG: ankyrin repeat domain-containing protein, partial [Acidobacteriota bacterium]